VQPPMHHQPPQRPERRAILTVFCALLGVATIGTALGRVAPPGSLASAPDLFSQVCAAAICVGALLCSASNLFPDRLVGLTVEKFAYAVLSPGSAMYVYALLTSARWHDAIIAAGSFGGIAVGGAVEWWVIRRYLRSRVQGA
jgi:hypothetical protein